MNENTDTHTVYYDKRLGRHDCYYAQIDGKYYRYEDGTLSEVSAPKNLESMERSTVTSIKSHENYKPLTAAAYDALEKDVNMLTKAQRLKKSAWLNLGMIFSYMGGNVLFAGTSAKDENVLDRSELMADAAYLVLQQPEVWQRQALVEDMVAYYAEHPAIQALDWGTKDIEYIKASLRKGIQSAGERLTASFGLEPRPFAVAEADNIPMVDAGLATPEPHKEATVQNAEARPIEHSQATTKVGMNNAERELKRKEQASQSQTAGAIAALPA